jgi:membrane-associated phospholipid phosphatase
MDLLMEIELLVNIFFQSLGEWLTPIAAGLSFLGTEEFYILLLPAIYWCIDAAIGFRIGIMLVATNSINGYLKMLFHSPRPFWVDARVKAFAQETSFGLPSGHSQNAASLWGLVAAKFKKRWLTIMSICAIVLIGWSRLYLGMHFTRDVLGGWLIGGLLIVLFLLLEKPVAKWIIKKSLAFQLLVIIFVAALVIGLGYAAAASGIGWTMPTEWIDQSLASGDIAPDPFNLEGCFTIAGVWVGFASGYAWWLKKFGKMTVAGSAGSRIARYFIGLTGLFALYLGLKLLFPESPLWLGLSLRFVRYMLIGLWVSALAPLLFKKLKLDK